jgi:perosamine synthetase
MRPDIHHSKPTFSKKDPGLFRSIFESSQIASAKIVGGFEKRFSSYIGCKGAVATNSGTSALHLALLALDIKKGDEVILPSYVCVSILDAVNYTGARPVLVDVDYNTFNISLEDARRKLTKKTKAVITPHMFGLPCDISGFLRLGIPIIEDCAQSLGARYKNRPTGSFGLMATFSFYATKLITTGYGGMIVSDSTRLLDRIRDLNEPDKRRDYKVRYNYKMSDLQAALGIGQLERYRYFIKKRRKIAKAYDRGLSYCDIKLPVKENNKEHVFYRYVIKSEDAGIIKRHLKKNNIEVASPVYRPLHSYLSMDKRNFPNAERLYKEAVSLPIYPALKKKEASKIIRVLRESVST